MASTPARSRSRPASRRASAGVWTLALALLASAQALRLGMALQDGAVGMPGRLAPDFLCFWIAARAAWAGHAAALYDWPSLHAIIESTLGHGFDGALPWKYPPSALPLLAPLALFSLPTAHIVWAFTTLAFWLAIVVRIAGIRAGLVALAAPLTAQEVLMGQNGFATAAVLGLALLLAERRPVASALVAGILACKPQLFLLLPVGLIARHGARALLAIALSAGALATLSAALFGPSAWIAFAASVHGNAASFDAGALPWSAVQSVFGAARGLTMPTLPAFALQAALAACVALAIVWMERQRVAVDLRHAALCAGTILATPFVLVWDLTLLGVGMAFFARAARGDGLHPGERIGIAGLVLSTQFYMQTDIPVGALDAAVLALMIARRAMPAPRAATQIRMEPA